MMGESGRDTDARTCLLEDSSMKPESAFDWRGKPSIFADTRKRHVVVDPSSVKFNGASLSGSIATPEKFKQKPGKGRSATA